MNAPKLNYPGLFDASPNPYLVLDRSLNIVGANRAYLAATKRELQDILGRWAWDAFPTDPETLKRSVESFERVIRTRQPDTMALLRFDIPRPESEGGGFEVRYWSITHTPVLDEAGEVELVMQHPIDVTELQRLREAAQARDNPGADSLGPALSGIVDRAQTVYEANLRLKEEIEARLQAELNLRDSERRLALALAAGGSAVWEMDVATGVVKGEEKLFTTLGYAPGELKTLADWFSLVHPEDRECVPRLFEEMLEGRREHYTFEARLRTRDGSWRWNLSQAVAAGRNAGGRAVRLVGTHTDITERKAVEAEVRRLNAELDERVKRRTAELERANEALVQSNIELQRFAYVASHDLQTPLRTIVGFSQILRSNLDGSLDDENRTLLLHIIEATGRMHTLIRDLLSYSRVETQAKPFEPVDFGDILEAVLLTLGQPIRETGARVTHGELPRVQGDRGQLTQLLQNLIENGIKYHGPEAPRIHIQAERQGGEWVFAVRDNGIGIAPRHFGKIFEIFKRLHSQQAYPGTGIGLAVCRRVVERHGGRIWVESEPGRGSTFFFSMPPAAGDQARGQASDATSAASRAARPSSTRPSSP